MRIITVIATAVLALAFAPTGSAQSVESTVWLHDLTTESGGYSGCHVTGDNFSTYRLTVQEGSTVRLTVRSYANNTNVHTVTIEGADAAPVQVAPGGESAMEFVASEAGSYGVICDSPGPLQGVIVARPASAGTGGNETPAPAVALVLALAAAVAIFRRRGCA